MASKLWIDKYRPKTLQELDYHHYCGELLGKLAASNDIPHLILYGPSGAGKKTRVLCLLSEIFGAGVSKVKNETKNFKEGSTTIEINILSSNHHMDMTPSDVGHRDRHVVQKVIKEIGSSRNIDSKAFKVLVLNQADSLTYEAQAALRRTLEKCTVSTRVILLCNSLCKVMMPLRSRCLCIRIPAPSNDDVLRILTFISDQEGIQAPQEFLSKVVQQSKRNLRRAIMMLQSAYVQFSRLTPSTIVPLPDWERSVKEIAQNALDEQTPRRLKAIRSKVYEILVSNIPATEVFWTLYKELTSHCDRTMKYSIAKEAARYEHQMQFGSKPIIHIEAFIAKIMSMYKSYMNSFIQLMNMALRRAFSHIPKFELVDPNSTKIPVFQVMDLNGDIVPGAEKYAELDKPLLMKIYQTMVQTQQFDIVGYDLQRQGRISFYMTNLGEEAVQVGCTAALDFKDWICPQYRELGAFLWRGFGMSSCMNQLFGNKLDRGEGKQMPVHYGAPELYIQNVTSPLCTQVPQASGIGYSYRLRNIKQVCCAIFGDGAASEGDFHPALNFAATLKAQVLFLCRNNQWAISTPVKEQYKGSGIAERGSGYGISAAKCDGNDIFAVYHATKESREQIVEQKEPVLLEAITYRRGHHSTSDDSLRYRDKKEVLHWEQVNNPILRLEKFLFKAGWLTQEEANEFKSFTRAEVLKMKDEAAATKLHSWKCLFENVWDKTPKMLTEQKQELDEHLKKYGELYDLDFYEA